MQRLEVSGAVRLIYKSLGVKGLMENVLRYLKSLAADGIRTPDRPPPSVAITLAKKTLLVSSLSSSSFPRLLVLVRVNIIITAARIGGYVMQ